MSFRRPPPFLLKTQKPTVAPDGERIMFTEPIHNMAAAIEWFKDKMRIDAQISSAPDGIYSWLFKHDGMIVIPVESAQEIGSVHANLWTWTPTLGKVYSAGELRKQGNRILYNLKSGSFMQPYLKTEEMRAAMVAGVDQKFRALGLTPVFLKCEPAAAVRCTESYEQLSGKSIISEASIITPERELFWYRQFFTEKPVDDRLSMNEIVRNMGTTNAVRRGGAGKRSGHRRSGHRRSLRYQARGGMRRALTRRRASI